MKRTLYLIWRYYLHLCAKLYLARTNPTIITISGAVGKTTTKDVTFAALEKALYTKRLRKTPGNLNNEIGVPLSILGFDHAFPIIETPRHYLKVLSQALFSKKADLLILEYAIDHPGDMDYLCHIARPDIAILTTIAEEHLEYLNDLDTVYQEEGKVLKYLKPEGTAIILYDKRLMQTFTPRRLTYGISKDADTKILDADINLSGTDLEVSLDNQILKLHSPLLGIDQNLSVLAALTVGSVLNTDLSLCIEGISSHLPTAGRLRPIEGKNNVTIIDDSYNASPSSMTAALKLLPQIAGSHRKVAILGTMRELGRFSESAHRQIGKLLPKQTDIVVLVGPYRDFMKEGAINNGMKENQIYTFETPEKAKTGIKKIIKKEDFVLIKASQNTMRFENITKSLMKDPKKAPELLVRQENHGIKN